MMVPGFLSSTMRIATALGVIACVGSAGAESLDKAVFATLTQVDGNVLVDSGSGFVRSDEDLRLKIGDRVLVSHSGGALIRFATGCELAVEAPSMTVVNEQTCRSSHPFGAGAFAGAGGITGSSSATTMNATGAGILGASLGPAAAVVDADGCPNGICPPEPIVISDGHPGGGGPGPDISP